MFDEILQAFGIKDYDSATPDEQATLRDWVDKVEKSSVTLDDVKNAVAAMRQSVDAELAIQRPGWKRLWEGDKDQFLKARLRNLIVLEALLSRPDKARAALNAYISRARLQSK